MNKESKCAGATQAQATVENENITSSPKSTAGSSFSLPSNEIATNGGYSPLYIKEKGRFGGGVCLSLAVTARPQLARWPSRGLDYPKMVSKAWHHVDNCLMQKKKKITENVEKKRAQEDPQAKAKRLETIRERARHVREERKRKLNPEEDQERRVARTEKEKNRLRQETPARKEKKTKD